MLLVVFLLAGILAGCGGGTANGKESRPAKLSFWLFNEVHKQFYEPASRTEWQYPVNDRRNL